MIHFEKAQLPQYDKGLSRGAESLQRLKICYSCRKGFCKRKGRAKAAPVANAPGRYLCQKCANAVISGKSMNNRVTMISVGGA